MNSILKFILAIVVVVVIVFLILYFTLFQEPFMNNKRKVSNVYRYWNKKLKELNQAPYNLGKPGGILKYNPNLWECNITNQNLIPQSKMTFRPTYRLNGCTVLDLEYPE